MLIGIYAGLVPLDPILIADLNHYAHTCNVFFTLACPFRRFSSGCCSAPRQEAVHFIEPSYSYAASLPTGHRRERAALSRPGLLEMGSPPL